MIARKSALIVTVRMLNGLLGYIALFFITRHMSPETYGIMAFAYSYVGLFSIIGSIGFNHAHIKRVSEGKDLGTCVGTFLATKTSLIGIMGAMVIGTILFWRLVMGRGFESSIHELAVYIMLGYWMIHLFTMVFIRTFQARREIAKAQLPLFFETAVRVVVTIYVAIADYGAIALVLTYIAGDVIFFISSLIFFRKYPIKKPTREIFKSYTTFAFPLVIVVSSAAIMNNIDKVLIQLFWNAADVGYYFATFRLTEFINAFTMAVGGLLFPTISALHVKKDIPGIQKLTSISERYLSMIVMPLVFGIVILAEPVVLILLSGWTPSVPIIRILPFFVLLSALERPFQSQFLGMDWPKLARNRIIIMVCCNITLNILLIPKDIQLLGLNLAGLGAVGAAIATVTSYALGLLYSRIMAWKLTSTKGNPGIYKHFIAAAIMTIVLYVMLYTYDLVEYIIRWYHLLGIALIGLAIYLAILYVTKEFTRKDLNMFLDTLNIRKMARYIKDEITRTKF